MRVGWRAPLIFTSRSSCLAPYRTGEIVAEASYDRKNEIMYFRSLTVKTGSQSIKVPKRILRFFIGPRFTLVAITLRSTGYGIVRSTRDGGLEEAGLL